MATKKTTDTDTPKKFAESAGAYLDRLVEAHERVAENVETIRARNSRIADKLVEAMIDGQRDALALGKTMTAEPTAYAKNMEAVMQSMTAAQERALDVAKTVYREQAEAAAEFRGVADKAFASGQAFAKPFEKMTAMWAPAAK